MDGEILEIIFLGRRRGREKEKREWGGSSTFCDIRNFLQEFTIGIGDNSCPIHFGYNTKGFVIVEFYPAHLRKK